MHRAYLPKALALVVLTTGLSFAGAQQTQPAPDSAEPPAQTAPMHQHRHRHDPAREAQMLGKKLNLSADQTAKIEPILAERNQKMEALRTGGQLSPDDLHQQMKTINQNAKQQMASVLSPDQMEQLKAMRHNRHGHRGQSNEQPSQAPTA